ncbi:HNH endonuclease [Myxosarcina sp. GI1]|uniref:HNH endonuclease n=1 Tax=Myxosarcina sp. GI1 TaxID=1541065 RepID=UPI0020A02AC5|nr:HNH endonuclease [Myxosarcina sp. GI1]
MARSPHYDTIISIQRSPDLKMPIDISLYPANWKALTLKIKEAANWCCECCGKRCYCPGERPESLTRSEWTADILQVHHRNHDTTDNRLSNLLSVCAACHLNLHRGKYSGISPGQLSLW